jgi:NADPH:quinone reductase-like Zn-dependent oxidoreductase
MLEDRGMGGCPKGNELNSSTSLNQRSIKAKPMKAIICTKYGSPDVLQLKEVAKPTPKDNEVLIRVHAAVVGPADCAFRKGDPFIIKLLYGLTRPKMSTQGVEFAGEIEAVGKAVKLFKQGDQVFGMSPDSFGAHAEYMCLPEDKPVVIKPANTTYEEAVGICDGATTALTFLRDVAKLQRGQKILINGASGAVGTYAVQLAKYYGAEVTGVCSTTNKEMVKSLGVDKIIDYTKEDFTKSGQPYDVIFDAVGKSSFSRCQGSLTQNGVYLSTVPTLGIVLQMLRTSMFGSKRAKFAAAGLMQNKDNLNFLKELIEARTIKSVIDRRYPLEQIAEAHRYVETGRKKGNVVITVA